MRNRRNITLEPEVDRMGHQLAKELRRSFAGLVAWLIDQEWQRRNAAELPPATDGQKEEA
jgi:hypothetical protein